VKLLFDQNLSRKLKARLSDCFPESSHVREFGLEQADDAELWRFAVERGFTIVTKDANFRQRSYLFGHPPKIIWIRRGNCSTSDIEALLRKRRSEIAEFLADLELSFLALW
jgi:predicted nuclease of predicted toxin-antitoxin system